MKAHDSFLSAYGPINYAPRARRAASPAGPRPALFGPSGLPCARVWIVAVGWRSDCSPRLSPEQNGRYDAGRGNPSSFPPARLSLHPLVTAVVETEDGHRGRRRRRPPPRHAAPAPFPLPLLFFFGESRPAPLWPLADACVHPQVSAPSSSGAVAVPLCRRRPVGGDPAVCRLPFLF